QRQREEELAESCYRHIGLVQRRQILAIDDGGMENAAIGHRGQIAATVAGGRSRFAAGGHVSDKALFDLIAVNAVSARHIGVAARATVERWCIVRACVINLPIGIEVPVTFSHPAPTRPCSIERKTRNLIRRTSDRPIGTPASGASILYFVAGENIALAHILRRLVVAVVEFIAKRALEQAKANIDALGRGVHEPRRDIAAALQEARGGSNNSDRVNQARFVTAKGGQIKKSIVCGSMGPDPAILLQPD